MDERRDRLDEALDNALASYGAAPQREGLERRILSRVTETASRTHLRSSRVLAVCAAAAVITMCLSWWLMPKMETQTLPATPAMLPLHKVEPPRTPTVLIPKPATVLASAAKPRRFRKKITEPKLSQFPTPSPLTSDERALVELVAHNQKDIPRDLAYLGGPVKPIYIAAVEIKPIQLESSTREERCCDQ